jgi:hypothetical protein
MALGQFSRFFSYVPNRNLKNVCSSVLCLYLFYTLDIQHLAVLLHRLKIVAQVIKRRIYPLICKGTELVRQALENGHFYYVALYF